MCAVKDDGLKRFCVAPADTGGQQRRRCPPRLAISFISRMPIKLNKCL